MMLLLLLHQHVSHGCLQLKHTHSNSHLLEQQSQPQWGKGRKCYPSFSHTFSLSLRLRAQTNLNQRPRHTRCSWAGQIFSDTHIHAHTQQVNLEKVPVIHLLKAPTGPTIKLCNEVRDCHLITSEQTCWWWCFWMCSETVFPRKITALFVSDRCLKTTYVYAQVRKPYSGFVPREKRKN